MTETATQEQQVSKADQWRERIAEQVGSGLSVRQFCKERALAEHAFYAWRKRLGRASPVRFALVERPAAELTTGSGLELVLPGGELLRIACGVDAATLRTVLDALRA